MKRRELFVWYRVATERADAARAAVLAMQQSLRGAWPGLQARLLVRHDGAVATWMETYARPASAPGAEHGIDDRIEGAIAAAALPLGSLIEGERHVEAFDALP